MGMIEVRYKSIPGGGLPPFHKYIIYTDSNGKEWYARGGSTEVGGPFPWSGDVDTDYGEYVKPVGDNRSPDWNIDKDGNVRVDGREPLLIGDDLSPWWDKIKNRMQEIEDGKYKYDADKQNSNTTADDALRYAGLREPRKDGTFPSPGSLNKTTGDGAQLILSRVNNPKGTEPCHAVQG